MKSKIRNPFKIITRSFAFQDVLVEASYYHGMLFHLRIPAAGIGIYRNFINQPQKPATVYIDGEITTPAQKYVIDWLFLFIDITQPDKYNEISVLDKQFVSVSKQFRQMINNGEIKPVDEE